MLLTLAAISNMRYAKKHGKDITLIEGYKYAIGSLGIMVNWAIEEIRR